MDAHKAIHEIIEQMPNFFGLTYRETVGSGREYETRVYPQRDIASHVASTLLDKLPTKGAPVVELPHPSRPTSTAARPVRVPTTDQAWAYGEVRIGDQGDRLHIVDIPSRLPIDDAPALLAAHAAARPYRSPWRDGAT
ncbi:hypothetical protein [Mycobacteroides salmoniphilum]|uniref:hypothetical protein n=1 Tax=Mycobacteroides salmoniphilum TaxID=404941 RepID=UPI0009925123|nr:hypothetical protein [Mycobacteroides salmoniphilum]